MREDGLYRRAYLWTVDPWVASARTTALSFLLQAASMNDSSSTNAQYTQDVEGVNSGLRLARFVGGALEKLSTNSNLGLRVLLGALVGTNQTT